MIDRRLEISLRELRDAVRESRVFVGSYSRERFLTDNLVQNVVAMGLVRIGEAATKIAQNHGDFVAAHPDVRWASMRGTRNIVAHAYHEVDFVILWQIVVDHLPLLAAWLDTVLEQTADGKSA